MFERLKSWAEHLLRDVFALSLAMRDKRVPWYAKAVGFLVVAYALSPIDLIPDFIPVIGYLDDMILVPIGVWLTLKLVPADVMAELREEAEGMTHKQLPANVLGGALVVLIWALLLYFIIRAVTAPAPIDNLA